MTRPAITRPNRFSGNVVALPIEPRPSPFDRLTARLVIERYRAGTLPEGVLVALLAGVGVHQ